MPPPYHILLDTLQLGTEKCVKSDEFQATTSSNKLSSFVVKQVNITSLSNSNYFGIKTCKTY